MAVSPVNTQGKLTGLSTIRLLDANADFPLIEMLCGESVVTVSLYGGQVLAYQNSRRSMLWHNRHAVFQQGKAIRSGIPVCWPWFGPGKTASGAAHGFARTEFWHIESASETPSISKLVLRLDDTLESRQIWPHRFALRLIIQLDEVSLKLMLQTENVGDTAFAMSGALHSYFAIEDISDVRIHDLENVEYFDQLSQSISVSTQPIAFREEIDRVYRTEKARVTLRDMAQQTATQLSCFGHNAIVVWNPWADKAERLTDIAPDHWRRFVCIETAIDPNACIQLEPGKRHAMGMEIHDASV